MAFVEDSLLYANGMFHRGEVALEDEELTPTLENFVVLTWLRLIHPDLPKLVKQRYGTDLRSRTLASIKPEISQALSSLVDEIRSAHDVKINMILTAVSNSRKPSGSRVPFKTITRPSRPAKTCSLCTQAGRSNFSHFLSDCSFLPDQHRNYKAKARQFAEIFNDLPEPELSPNIAEPEIEFDESVLC